MSTTTAASVGSTSSHYLKIVITTKEVKRIDEDSELHAQVMQRIRLSLYKYGWTSQALTLPERLFYSEFICHDTQYPPTCSTADEESIAMGRYTTDRICQKIQQEFEEEGVSVLIWCKQYTYDWSGNGQCVIRTPTSLSLKHRE